MRRGSHLALETTEPNAFHHWHHAAEREAVNTNFAVHTPLWDGWIRQLLHPLKRL